MHSLVMSPYSCDFKVWHMDINTTVLYCACMYVTIAILYGVRWLDYKYSLDLPRGTLHGVRMMNLQPPASFSFAKSEEWPKWKCHFEQYRQASGLTENGELRQVSTLIYCLGPGAEEVLDTTRISEEDKQKYDKVVDEFDNISKLRKV